jgi:hypothetical protein
LHRTEHCLPISVVLHRGSFELDHWDSSLIFLEGEEDDHHHAGGDHAHDHHHHNGDHIETDEHGRTVHRHSGLKHYHDE